MSEETQKRFPLWIYPETQQKVKELYEKDNCKSQSEFIEKAILFYCGYVSSYDSTRFLPTAITSAFAGIIEGSENRMARLLFKLAVEMSMMMNILASNAEIDETLLQRLRGKCINDVKRTTGTVNCFEQLTDELYGSYRPHQDRGKLRTKGEDIKQNAAGIKEQLDKPGMRTPEDKQKLISSYMSLALNCVKAQIFICLEMGQQKNEVMQKQNF